MNRAAKGRRLEHEIKRLLEAHDWSVMRGAGSRGHFDSTEGQVKADLIASKSGRTNKSTLQIIVVQCKVERK